MPTIAQMIGHITQYDPYEDAKTEFYRLKNEEKTYASIKRWNKAKELLLHAKPLKPEILALKDKMDIEPGDKSLEFQLRLKYQEYINTIEQAERLMDDIVDDNPKSYWMEESVAFITGCLRFDTNHAALILKEEIENQIQSRARR